MRKFVEFYGPGLTNLSVADRATIANMAPEYGATIGFFPVDEETLTYLRLTGRDPELVDLVERYTKAQGLFRTDDSPEPLFSETLELDMSTVEPSLAGPKRPQDRVPLKEAKKSFLIHLHRSLKEGGFGLKNEEVIDYLKASGLMHYLEALRFHLVGYGCTTCIGNSGPLPEDVSNAVEEGNLVAVAVLSGNRNFEGRIHPQVRANYLASPMLVVTYAIAGRIDIDFITEPLGYNPQGRPIYLKEIWPTQEQVLEAIRMALAPQMFKEEYARVFEGNELWKTLPTLEGELYNWDPTSTYIQEPPFFQDLTLEPTLMGEIRGARVLVLLGDSITTDHISPAGSIPASSPAGQYLISKGVTQKDFNSYGSRRGNHYVMIRGTFAHIRLKNLLLDGVEGWYTLKLPEGEQMTIYDAAMKYKEEGTPLIVLAGKEYGSGSSRDWAAKGPYLLGIKAVIAESFERIHRSNLVCMGILPLQFKPGENVKALGLTGKKAYDIIGLEEVLTPEKELTVVVRRKKGDEVPFPVIARLETPVEVDYYRNGGILQAILRRLMEVPPEAKAE